MNLSEIFIRRPIMTTLVMVALLLAGLVSYRQLPVSDLPNVDFPTIQVSASLPGANPETMAASVATPLERQFTAIPGLSTMNSTSAQGSTQITLQFDLDRNIDAAAQDVQTAIAAAGRQLPTGMPSPPTYRKVNPAEQPVLFISVNSPTLPLSQVDEYAETVLAQRLSSLSGVAQINVFGAQKYAVRVQLDPNALAARGISLEDVSTSLQQHNANLPSGTLNGSHRALVLQADGQLQSAAEYRRIMVAYRNGAPVRLDELGRVTDSVENPYVASWYNGTRGVVLAVQRQPGSNTIAVADSVLKELPALRSQIPASVNLELVYNRAESIRASVHDVQFTLGLAIALVVLIIFLFLRNASATLIPSLALPGSILATFAAMALLHFNLDNLSLMALTLSTGFVVDDAIVMLENIVRRMEQGQSAMQAALDGSREIGFTIVAMTISLVAVFIPVLFMGGIVGRLFNEFALTITSAILVSGVISLTFTPMLASRMLRPPGKEGPLGSALERGFDAMRGAYAWALRTVLAHRRLALLASLALIGVTAWLFAAVPKGFIPTEDTGMLMGSTQAIQGISFDEMVRHQQLVADIIRQDPNIDAVMSSAGAGGRNATSNAGTMFIRLKPRSERSLGAGAIVDELRPKLARVPGIRTVLQVPPSIRIGGQLTRAQYQLTLKGRDLEAMYRATPELESRLRELPDLMDVTSELQLRNPQISVDIDRDRASALGVTATQIESALYNAYGNRQVSQIYSSSNLYQVVMELLPQFQQDSSAFGALYVRSSTGRLVPLSAVATLRPDVGPTTVTHLDQSPSTTLSFNLKPGASLGSVTQQVEAIAKEALPEGVTASFQGTAQAFQSSFSGMGILLVLAIAVIYLILGILYESFKHPITVLSGLPAAGLGALATLMLFGRELDLYGFVGLIMLIGIVKKNAIMLIDFALEAQREGKSPEAAIYEACLVRFRPIMMTTMAALVGALPIALAIGAGAEARQPLGLTVVGGLVVSQLLTLFITPVVYLALERTKPADPVQSDRVAVSP